jgi:hypothetical protein
MVGMRNSLATIMLASAMAVPVPAAAAPILDAHRDPAGYDTPDPFGGGWYGPLMRFPFNDPWIGFTPTYSGPLDRVEILVNTSAPLKLYLRAGGPYGNYVLAESTTVPVATFDEKTNTPWTTFTFSGVTVEAYHDYRISLDLLDVIETRFTAQAYQIPLQVAVAGEVIAFRAWVDPVASSFPGDVNGNHRVDVGDFWILEDNFGEIGDRLHGDLTGDGRISLDDFRLLKSNVGRRELAPEPASLVLALTGLVVLSCRLRRPSRRAGSL